MAYGGFLDHLNDTLSQLTQAQRERLAYIEVKSFFCGDLTRADIERRFGVRPAASARDLAAYRRLAPHNLAYSAAFRRYVPSAAFQPVFNHSAERVLTWFRSAVGDGQELPLKRPIPCEGASALVNPDLKVLATITRAITAKELLRVDYLSLTSGRSRKVLAPIALADTGLRWHLRAYDQEKARFADFVLTRVVSAQSLNAPIPEEQSLGADQQWARVVRLELVPHPGIAHPDAIEADYGMSGGVLTLQMRAPLVGYALRRWSVDCSSNHALDPKAFHLWLRNLPTLYGVESAMLAPGYAPAADGDPIV